VSLFTKEWTFSDENQRWNMEKRKPGAAVLLTISQEFGKSVD
jgi:hypothetical protein